MKINFDLREDCTGCSLCLSNCLDIFEEPTGDGFSSIFEKSAHRQGRRTAQRCRRRRSLLHEKAKILDIESAFHHPRIAAPLQGAKPGEVLAHLEAPKITAPVAAHTLRRSGSIHRPFYGVYQLL